jgi:hypothetical protein
VYHHHTRVILQPHKKLGDHHSGCSATGNTHAWTSNMGLQARRAGVFNPSTAAVATKRNTGTVDCQSHNTSLCIYTICIQSLQSRTCTVAIMVAMYTPAVKGSRGISDSTRLARTSLPTYKADSTAASQWTDIPAPDQPWKLCRVGLRWLGETASVRTHAGSGWQEMCHPATLGAADPPPSAATLVASSTAPRNVTPMTAALPSPFH